MTVYAGDKAPTTIRFQIATAAAGINGTLVASVRLRVLKRDGTTQEWGPYVPTSTTTSTVAVQHTLASGAASGVASLAGEAAATADASGLASGLASLSGTASGVASGSASLTSEPPVVVETVALRCPGPLDVASVATALDATEIRLVCEATTVALTAVSTMTIRLGVPAPTTVSLEAA